LIFMVTFDHCSGTVHLLVADRDERGREWFVPVPVFVHQPQDDAFNVAVQARQVGQALAAQRPAGGGAGTRGLLEQGP
jgi:hypothetical protein